MGLIPGAKLASVLIIGQIIFTIRKLQSTLQQIGRIVLRIVKSGRDPQPKQIRGVKVRVVERVYVGAQTLTQGTRQFPPVMDRSDRIQVRAKRREAFRLDGGLVHVGVVEICDLARARACGRVGLGNLFYQVGGALVAQVIQCGKDVHLGPIRWNFRVLDPSAVGILIKIVPRINRGIQVGDRDAVHLWRGRILRAGDTAYSQTRQDKH